MSFQMATAPLPARLITRAPKGRPEVRVAPPAGAAKRRRRERGVHYEHRRAAQRCELLPLRGQRSAEGASVGVHYCAFIFAALTILADASMSSATNFLNCAALIGIASAPRLAKRSLISALVSERWTSLLIRSTRSGGMATGPNMPTHRL